MLRRNWPAALAAVSVLVFGSYLAYTQHLVREVRRIARVHAGMYSLVQRGLVSGEPGIEQAVLWQLQDSLLSLGLPTVVVNTEGRPTAARNLPFAVDLNSPQGVAAVLAYVRDLERRGRGTRAVVPGWATVYFGEPPLLRWLKWVPWLQVAGGIMLILVAVAIIRSEMRAERERLWAAMARELAHQMGTPLSSLSGWLEVLRLPAAEREELAGAKRIAQEMGADVERLERVSRRFELIGKPSALERVPVRAVLEELERYFRPRLPKLGVGIRLRVRVAEGLPSIQANPVLLVWALENVVKNAVDALGGRGGKILVHAEVTSPREVHIQIADNGPGIAAGLRDRIFDPGVTTKTGGWGVGLSLTRRIIEQLHGGRVMARPRGRRGTVFDIVLPASAGVPAGEG